MAPMENKNADSGIHTELPPRDESKTTSEPDKTSKKDSSPPQMTDPSLLTKIDKLFAYGVGDYINLPQLVVVGDQSSGKSSVLEGLTKLPFPRDSTLCTRFATQIAFRRSQESKVTISVLPAPGSSQTYQEKLRRWQKTEADTLKPERFASIMKEVQELMGVGPSTDKKASRGFSEDVLRIEICGPEQDHFSIVDVPGIFRVPEEGKTTKADMVMVKNLVEGYMKNSRSVMLAVVGANVDVATQDILTMAKEADPDGIRTIGVLTKPDLVDRGAESAVISLLEGKSYKLNLGWSVVKNLAQYQLKLDSIDRDLEERAFFRDNEPWNKLENDRFGITSLRARLQDILTDLIRREFPIVKSEIQRKLTAARKSLEALGNERETAGEQRQFLIDLCTRYHHHKSCALNSEYNSSEHFDHFPILRLPTAVVDRNNIFMGSMLDFGHVFDLNGKDIEREEDSSENDGEDEGAPKGGNPEAAFVRQFNETAYVEDIQDIIIGDDTTVDSLVKTNSAEWLERVYEQSRGFELGTFDKNLLAAAMKTQSSKWEAMALGYISDMINMVHTFINTLFEALCPQERVRSELLSRLMDDLLERYRAAFGHIKFLLQVERAGVPVTLNTDFHHALGELRGQRVKNRIAKKAFANKKSESPSLVVALHDAIALFSTDNKDYLLQEIRDILRSYYAVARDRFIDNVCMQAGMHFLIRGSDDTPLELFSPAWIQKLSDAELDEIAGEEPVVRQKRADLKKQIRNLEEGRKILR